MITEVLTDLRPSIVHGERTTEGALSQEVFAEQAFNQVTGIAVPIGHDFEPQFVAPCIPRGAPWACNCICGGADYPGLFTDWDMLEVLEPHAPNAEERKPWRRKHEEALRPCV